MSGLLEDYEALLERMNKFELPVANYNVLAILESLRAKHHSPLADLDDQALLAGVIGYERSPQTTTPCPTWCTDPPNHPFDSLAADASQVRLHSREVEHHIAPAGRADEPFIALVQEDRRSKGDDLSTSRSPVAVSVVIDCELDQGDLRRLAAALLNAADLLAQVTTPDDH